MTSHFNNVIEFKFGRIFVKGKKLLSKSLSQTFFCIPVFLLPTKIEKLAKKISQSLLDAFRRVRFIAATLLRSEQHHITWLVDEIYAKRWYLHLSCESLLQSKQIPFIWGQFHQHFTSSFYSCRSQMHKKPVKSSSFFELLGSALVKAARKNIGEIDPCQPRRRCWSRVKAFRVQDVNFLTDY